MEADTTQTSQENKPTLGVQDLVLVAQTIQIATSRGAWKADELSTVGAIYDKLIGFLEAAGAVTRNETDGSAPSDQSSAESQEN